MLDNRAGREGDSDAAGDLDTGEPDSRTGAVAQGGEGTLNSGVLLAFERRDVLPTQRVHTRFIPTWTTQHPIEVGNGSASM
jgi:hypothetical protein